MPGLDFRPGISGINPLTTVYVPLVRPLLLPVPAPAAMAELDVADVLPVDVPVPA